MHSKQNKPLPYRDFIEILKRKRAWIQSPGTNRNAIKSKLPAPAIEARIRPKSVGIVLDAKNIADNPTSMITK